VSQVLFCCSSFLKVDGQFAITVHQIVHGFTPPPVQNQYVMQGMGGRLSVEEDAFCIVLAQVQSCEPARQLGARGKRRGFSPGAAARHSLSARAGFAPNFFFPTKISG